MTAASCSISFIPGQQHNAKGSNKASGSIWRVETHVQWGHSTSSRDALSPPPIHCLLLQQLHLLSLDFACLLGFYSYTLHSVHPKPIGLCAPSTHVAVSFIAWHIVSMDHPACSVVGLSTLQTLMPTVDGKRRQVACVWSCHSQWLCIGRGCRHTEQAACNTSSVMILCLVVSLLQRDIRHCHCHRGGLSKITATDWVAKCWQRNDTGYRNFYYAISALYTMPVYPSVRALVTFLSSVKTP